MNTKKIIKNILEWFIYIIIFIIIVWGTPKLLVKILHTDYPIASITSSSMWPALKQYDIVFIQGVTGKQEVKVGDIVVYKNPSTSSPQPGSGQAGQVGFTIHRIVELNDSTLITKGDANNVDDQPVKYEQLMGKMVTFRGSPLRIPYLGQLSQLFKKPR